MVESAEGVGELLEELKNNTFKKYDAFTVGEVFNMKLRSCRSLSVRMGIFQRYLIFVHSA